MIETSHYRFLTSERDGAVAILTLANPQRRNPLSSETMTEMLHALEEIGRDRSLKAVIVRALGPAFSAGHDLKEVRCAGDANDLAAATEIFDLCVRMMTAVQTIPQPVIAEVTGVATAAGCQLVATCDLAIAASDARFATPGVNIGLFCTTPMVALTRAIGRKRAMEMLLTGDFIDAATAAEWGLINRSVAPELLHDEVMQLARKIASAASATVAVGKRAFYEQIDRPQSEAYAYARDVMSHNALAADAREGIGAFLERRPPEWTT